MKIRILNLEEREMKQILYDDNNNNASYLINILVQVQQQVETVISWELSEFDFIIVDVGDFFNGIMPPEIEEVYNFRKKIERQHVIVVEHNYLLKILKNIRTVYYANMKTTIGNNMFSIKIFDGDIIEIRGNIENNILLQLEIFSQLVRIVKSQEDIMDMIKDFLYSEMSIEELYKEVIFFINSDEIQKGEFEGNQYILRKKDKENFILYAE